jgi:hypothetical protein
MGRTSPARRLRWKMSGSSHNARWLVAAAAAIVLFLLLLSRVRAVDRADVHGAADATAYELERTPVKGLGLTIFDVEEALTAGTRGGRRYGSLASRLKVTSAAQDSRGDLYEITTSGGDHPVCLAVKVDIDLTSSAPSFPTTEVVDGHCQPG